MNFNIFKRDRLSFDEENLRIKTIKNKLNGGINMKKTKTPDDAESDIKDATISGKEEENTTTDFSKMSADQFKQWQEEQQQTQKPNEDPKIDYDDQLLRIANSLDEIKEYLRVIHFLETTKSSILQREE